MLDCNTGWVPKICLKERSSERFFLQRPPSTSTPGSHESHLHPASLLSYEDCFDNVPSTMPHDEPVRVPLDEVRRTLERLDRRHARGRPPRRRGGSRHTRAAPREEPVRVPLGEIRQRLDQLDREHAEAQSRRRLEMPSSTVARVLASREITWRQGLPSS